MNRSLWKNAAITLLVVSPIVLFFAGRAAVSWQPRKVTDLPYVQVIEGVPFAGIIALSPDEHLVANASRDEEGLVSVLALPSGKRVEHHVVNGRISCLAFSPDGQRLAIAYQKMKLAMHETEIGSHRIGLSLWEFKGQYRNLEMAKGDWVYDTPAQLRFSPDGKTLWMASSDNLRTWNISSGRFKWQWRKGEGRGSSLPFFSALSPDCRLNFRSDSDGYSVWDMETKKRVVHTKLPFLADSDLNFSSDSYLATYYADTPEGIFNPVIETRTGRKLWQSKGEPEFTLVAGKAVRQKESSFEVYDARNGKFLYMLPAPPNTTPLPSASSRWLYTINDKNELFRQRLQ